ncbi:hypothetical protein [Paraburkholderia pallida]|uniref:Uncharacterized protein n=1 Tax=Paraburkholderia pallida TaxID=2547399 RepID=A0A4P7CVS0_9BURK|nr:hypothetical protein [Paraburkholderia pallida]QBQ98191.1 hypothetical protein E1956_14085 [Paraburkholderia pallida]
MNEQQLRAIHAQASAAVARTDRTLTPAEDRFWPLYLAAEVTAASATKQTSWTQTQIDGLLADADATTLLPCMDRWFKEMNGEEE